VGIAAGKAAKEGFTSAVQETIWTVVALLAGAFVLGFTLPLKAAQQGDWANQDWGGGGQDWGGQGGQDGQDAAAWSGSGPEVPNQSGTDWQQYSGTQNTAD
jgi:hypothetical protein